MSVVRRKVHWGDCAPSGAVFYPSYFRWFDEGAWELFASLHMPIGELGARYGIVGLPLMSCDCEFRGPCRLGDELTIESLVEEIDASVIVIRHNVANDGLLAVTGRERRFWGVRHADDRRRLRQGTIPDDVIAVLRQSLAGEAVGTERQRT